MGYWKVRGSQRVRGSQKVMDSPRLMGCGRMTGSQRMTGFPRAMGCQRLGCQRVIGLQRVMGYWRVLDSWAGFLLSPSVKLGWVILNWVTYVQCINSMGGLVVSFSTHLSGLWAKKNQASNFVPVPAA